MALVRRLKMRGKIIRAEGSNGEEMNPDSERIVGLEHCQQQLSLQFRESIVMPEVNNGLDLVEMGKDLTHVGATNGPNADAGYSNFLGDGNNSSENNTNAARNQIQTQDINCHLSKRLAEFGATSSGTQHAVNARLHTPLQPFLDHGQFTSLQDLLLAFSSGTLTLHDNEVAQQVPFVSNVHDGINGRNVSDTCKVGRYQTSVEVNSSSSEEFSIDEYSGGGSRCEGYEAESSMIEESKANGGSDPDNDYTNAEEYVVGCSVGANMVDTVQQATLIQNVNDFDGVNWDRFYSTGQLYTENPNTEDTEYESQVSREPDNKIPWKKRRRVKIGPNRQESRRPTGMGAVERAMREYVDKKKQGYVFEPRVGMEFDSEGEALEFYNLYSWEVGFGVRKGNKDGNKDGYTTVRELVCLKQGYDKRVKTLTKRCHCKAMIKLHRTEDHGWFISSFVKEHNHELSATNEEKREWKPHGTIDDRAREIIKNLRDNNVSLNRVHCIMGSMHGSMDNVPFTRRSLRTICAQIAREQVDDDIKKTLTLFRQMRHEDPGFQFSVELDANDQINTLMWASGRGRSNYCSFGDVVTFDTTYCTNLYKMPFGLFVGVNNHFQTTIFAAVLMRNETAESFTWVFNEFLTLMGGLPPQTILTDQCKAMEVALKIVMPTTTHLWCRWHVFRYARTELGTVFRENTMFKDDFHRVITEMYTIDEFTHAWDALLKKYKLETHHYMVNAYEKRERWAKCYNKGSFCARMTSTQRSESANHMLKTVVPKNSSINRFVQNLNKLLYMRYAEEERAEHETKQVVRVNKVLWDVEKHALKIYTRKVYEMFSKEMQKIHSYGVPKTSDGVLFIVRHTNSEYVGQYRRAEFRVISVNKGERYQCECGLYEHFGLLCCHVLRVFVHLGVSEIPQAHIMSRWTRKARDLIPQDLKVRLEGSSVEHGKMYLQSQIYGKALEVARKGNYNFDASEIVMKYLQKADRKVDELIQSQIDRANGIDKSPITAQEGTSSNYSTSKNEGGCGNKFGASGSCAGMSDEEVMNIKAPPRVRKEGRPKEKRYTTFLDNIDKKSRSKCEKKKAEMKAAPSVNGKNKNKNNNKPKSTKITPHCSICRLSGHNKTKCPERGRNNGVE